MMSAHIVKHRAKVGRCKVSIYDGLKNHMCHEIWRKGDPGILRRSFLKIGFANIDHQALGLPAF